MTIFEDAWKTAGDILDGAGDAVDAIATDLVGIGLAQLVFAIPGVVRGESLRKAWLGETIWRLTKLAECFGGDAAKAVVDKLSLVRDALYERARAAFPDFPIEEALRSLDVSAADLAREFGIEAEHAVVTLLAALRSAPIPRRSVYDERTGSRRVFNSVAEVLAALGLERTSSVRRVASGSVRAWLRSP